jgi:hypothetical protein
VKLGRSILEFVLHDDVSDLRWYNIADIDSYLEANSNGTEKMSENFDSSDQRFLIIAPSDRQRIRTLYGG